MVCVNKNDFLYILISISTLLFLLENFDDYCSVAMFSCSFILPTFLHSINISMFTNIFALFMPCVFIDSWLSRIIFWTSIFRLGLAWGSNQKCGSYLHNKRWAYLGDPSKPLHSSFQVPFCTSVMTSCKIQHLSIHMFSAFYLVTISLSFPLCPQVFNGTYTLATLLNPSSQFRFEEFCPGSPSIKQLSSLACEYLESMPKGELLFSCLF